MTPDEQEARSYGYVTQQGVIRLRSGLYAIFDRYDYHGQKMPLLHIGTWAECEAFVTEYRPPGPKAPPIRAQELDLDLELDL